MGKRGPKPGSGRSGGPHVGILGGRPVSSATMIRKLGAWRAALANGDSARWTVGELTQVDDELLELSQVLRVAISQKLDEVDNGQS